VDIVLPHLSVRFRQRVKSQLDAFALDDQVLAFDGRALRRGFRIAGIVKGILLDKVFERLGDGARK